MAAASPASSSTGAAPAAACFALSRPNRRRRRRRLHPACKTRDEKTAFLQAGTCGLSCWMTSLLADHRVAYPAEPLFHQPRVFSLDSVKVVNLSSTFPGKLGQTVRGEHLGQDLPFLARRVPQVERNARGTMRGQETSDFRIASRPVANDCDHTGFLERFPGGFALDRHAFVDLAGQAPVRGEPHEHRLARCT